MALASPSPRMRVASRLACDSSCRAVTLPCFRSCFLAGPFGPILHGHAFPFAANPGKDGRLDCFGVVETLRPPSTTSMPNWSAAVARMAWSRGPRWLQLQLVGSSETSCDSFERPISAASALNAFLQPAFGCAGDRRPIAESRERRSRSGTHVRGRLFVLDERFAGNSPADVPVEVQLLLSSVSIAGGSYIRNRRSNRHRL